MIEPKYNPFNEKRSKQLYAIDRLFSGDYVLLSSYDRIQPKIMFSTETQYNIKHFTKAERAFIDDYFFGI